MSNDLLKFARWIDDLEQVDPGRKFASIEEAVLVYQDLEGLESPADKFVARIPAGSIGLQADSDDDLSLDIIARAMKDKEGEYFYLAYAPGPNDSALMDMSIKKGERLVDVLASYALQQNAGEKVTKFTLMVNRILVLAQNHILREGGRRARDN